MEPSRKKTLALQAAVVLIAAAAVGYVWADRGGYTASLPAGDRKQITEFSLPDLAGQKWRLSDNRGKVVVLNFWATWCPPCRAETPGLVEIARAYKPKGVEVVGVVMDDDRDAPVQQFIHEFQIGYPILRPPEDSQLFNAISSLPTTLLIDRNGRVAKTYQGAASESQFRRDIDTLLAE